MKDNFFNLKWRNHGAYFFEKMKNEFGITHTVNGINYRTMLTDFFVPVVQGIAGNDIWFQQNGCN